MLMSQLGTTLDTPTLELQVKKLKPPERPPLETSPRMDADERTKKGR